MGEKVITPGAIRQRRSRAKAKQEGRVRLSDVWWKRNPDKHRKNVRAWRKANPLPAHNAAVKAQRKRRSTPWGLINNRIWPVMHTAVRSNSSRPSKYTQAIGYTWSALRGHLESQFSNGMTWENWGTVWELDHTEPVSLFKYRSLDDPLFRRAWALSNLRPLLCADNWRKGKRVR